MSPAFRKVMASLVVLPVLGTILLAGCSGNAGNRNDVASTDKAANSGNAQTAAAASGAGADNPVNSQKFDPPITISTAVIDENRPNAFKQGESLQSNAWTDWMRENMGIEVKYQWIFGKAEDMETKIKLALSSGEQLPDTFGAGGQVLQNLISANRLMPLNDAIGKYGSQTLKDALNKFPNTLSEATKDGKIYGIPVFFMGDEGSVMWVRKDWLDKLQLAPPTTIDELTNVMKAFTENDPDGDNKKDTYGLAVPLSEGPWTWMGQTDAIVGAFSPSMIDTNNLSAFWNKGPDGKLVYGAVNPDAKKYLQTMNDWMSKGYISKDAGVQDPGKASELASSGKAGIMFGPYWMGAWPLGDTVKVDPNAQWVAYSLPTGPDGLSGRAQKQLYNGYMVFNKDFQHIDAWFAYYNKILAEGVGPSDPYFDPRLKDGYLEGYDYVNYNGKHIASNFEAEGVPKDRWPLPDGSSMDLRLMIDSLLSTTAPIIPYSNKESLAKFVANPDAEAETQTDLSIKGLNPVQLQAAGVWMQQVDQEIPNLFSGPLTPTMKSKGDFLRKMATQDYLKMIYGDKPISYFDTFVQEWYDNGGTQITAEVNDWYANQ